MIGGATVKGSCIKERGPPYVPSVSFQFLLFEVSQETHGSLPSTLLAVCLLLLSNVLTTQLTLL